MKRISVLLLATAALFTSCNTTKSTMSANKTKNDYYWQQNVDYTMDIDVDAENYQYKGKQELVYTNNSPDVLNKVYYHLFFNAFQPGSEMDVRLATIQDPDSRMVYNAGTKENPIKKSRIADLKPNEVGYIKVNSLKQDGAAISHFTQGTILEVTLKTPLQPGKSTTLSMDFDAQVPVQIRRSGRNSKEGVAFSMTQWYPKLAEYDFEGWHADPYLGREFHGVWGEFDVTLHIDKEYTVGGTGYLQNPNEIGHGYETGKVTQPEGDKLTWKFNAPNVHDFTWAADKNYIHTTKQVENGPLLHFLYKKDLDAKFISNWEKLPAKTVELMNYYGDKIGKYPYKQYSVIQGGDGGMEYGMCTLITGKRSYGSLVGVTAHELAHNWFQFLLASNESKHEWMDEGFTTYISNNAVNEILDQKKENPNAGGYRGYYYLLSTGKEQPQTTHSDRFDTNLAYGIGAYNKGSVFLAQLAYVIGEENLAKTLKQYFVDFAFRHPRPVDFIHTAEKVSGMSLNWYLIDWTQTTNKIDYSVEAVSGKTITLKRNELMPMPIDLTVEYTDGTTEDYYIPLALMRGEKKTSATQIKDWAWAYPTYTFNAKKDVKSVTIDPKNLMADADKTNNKK